MGLYEKHGHSSKHFLSQTAGAAHIQMTDHSERCSKVGQPQQGSTCKCSML